MFFRSGTIYKLDPSTGTETQLYHFVGGNNDGQSPNGSLLYEGGQLYGTTSTGGADDEFGTIFKVDANSGAETVLYFFALDGEKDGGIPPCGLIRANGGYYGITSDLGKGAGTLFSFTP